MSSTARIRTLKDYIFYIFTPVKNKFKYMKIYLYFLLASVLTHSCNPTFQNQSKKTVYDFDLAIQNVEIFDSKNKAILSHKTILIKGDSIVDLLDDSQKFISKNTIDGNGRLAVPGFIDTHMHLGQIYGDGANGHQKLLENDDSFRRVLSDQYLAYGTTTILDMGQYAEWMDVSLDWHKNPAPDYPNLFLSSMKLISSGDGWPYTYEGFKQVMNADDAERTLAEYDHMGIRYIKLYKLLRMPEMKILTDEAKKYRMITFAHTEPNNDNNVTINQAMDLGVRNFEHFYTLAPSVLNLDVDWPKMKEKYNLKEIGSQDEFGAKMIFFFKFIKENPKLSGKLTALIDRLSNEGATLSTTIHPLGSIAGTTYPNSFSSWAAFPLRKSAFLPNYTETKKQELKKAFNTMMQVLKEAHDKGVKIRIGTDCRYGGKALLSELMLMSEAQFNMEEILQIATWNGAEAMHILDDYGSIAKGKKADLVLFDNNPFDDYKNLIGGKTVIKGGKVFEKRESMTPKILDEITANGVESGIEWIKNYKERPIRADEINEVAFELMKDGEITDAIAVFKYKDASYEGAGNVYNNLVESNMYPTGYHLVEIGRTEDAILSLQVQYRTISGIRVCSL